jgi:uncharacterized membrane protein YgaE (UPF0421/DUF939 family)
MNKIMKPVVAAVIPVLTVLGSYIATGEWNASDWWLALTGFATAAIVAILTVLLPDNSDRFLARWGKAIGAALAPLVSAVIQSLATGSFSRAEWATAVVGVATAALMAYVNNTPDS